MTLTIDTSTATATSVLIDNQELYKNMKHWADKYEGWSDASIRFLKRRKHEERIRRQKGIFYKYARYCNPMVRDLRDWIHLRKQGVIMPRDMRVRRLFNERIDTN